MTFFKILTFLLLFLRRETSVRDLMCKHISIESSDQDAVIEDFLHLHLNIPKTWIHLAKVKFNMSSKV